MTDRRRLRWTDIADVLRAEILSGQWPAGAELPNLPALAERFGVHRATVAAALQHLTAEGLLEAAEDRRRRRVARQQAKSRRAVAFWEDPAWRAPRLETVAFRVEAPPPPVAARMGDHPLLHWQTRQFDGDEVVALSDAWYEPTPWLIDFALHPEGSFYERLAADRGLTLGTCHEIIEARIATPEEQRAFRHPGRAPLVVLVVQREVRAATGEVLEMATLVDRATRYALEYTVPMTVDTDTPPPGPARRRAKS